MRVSCFLNEWKQEALIKLPKDVPIGHSKGMLSIKTVCDLGNGIRMSQFFRRCMKRFSCRANGMPMNCSKELVFRGDLHYRFPKFVSTQPSPKNTARSHFIEKQNTSLPLRCLYSEDIEFCDHDNIPHKESHWVAYQAVPVVSDLFLVGVGSQNRIDQSIMQKQHAWSCVNQVYFLLARLLLQGPKYFLKKKRLDHLTLLTIKQGSLCNRMQLVHAQGTLSHLQSQLRWGGCSQHGHH